MREAEGGCRRVLERVARDESWVRRSECEWQGREGSRLAEDLSCDRSSGRVDWVLGGVGNAVACRKLKSK